jgi:pimeloyl-ACP methyl ester carboxylesterase
MTPGTTGWWRAWGASSGRITKSITRACRTRTRPPYAGWKAAIGRALAKLDDGAILIGHSIGGTILIHALAEAPPGCAPAPSCSLPPRSSAKAAWPSDDIAPKRDRRRKARPGLPVHLFNGSADETAPPPHADLYGQAIPQARIHRLPGRDHQLNNDLSEVARVVRQLDRAAVRRR